MEETENPEILDVSEPTEEQAEEKIELTEDDNETSVAENETEAPEEDAEISLPDVGNGIEAQALGSVKFTIDGADAGAEGAKATVSGEDNAEDGSYQFTVTPAAGYQVAAANGVVVTYGTENKTDVTAEPVDNTNTYKISADDITNKIAESNVTIAITTEAVKNTVTVAQNVPDGATAADVFKDAKYTLSTEQNPGTETDLGASIADVTVEHTLKVTFTLADGYEAAVTRKAGTGEAVTVEKDNTSAGSSYVYVFDNITEATTLTFTATAVKTTNTVTVTVPAAGVEKVTYTTDGTAPNAETANVINSPTGTIELAQDAQLKLYIKPADHYAVTVKKGTLTIGGGAGNVYEIPDITEDTAVAITAEKSEYLVTANISAAAGSGEDVSGITVKWKDDSSFTANQDGKSGYLKKEAGLSFSLEGVEEEQRVTVTCGSKTYQPSASDIYNIPPADITDDITIQVEVRGLAAAAIKWDPTTNNKVSKVLYQTTEGTGAYDQELNGTGKTVKEESTFSFKVETLNGYEVKEVTAADAAGKDVAVTPTTEGEVTIYSLTVGNTTEINLNITTQLDATKAYTLVLKMADGSDAGSAAVTVTDGDDTEADDPALSGTLSTAEDGTVEISTLNGVINAAVAAEAHYELAAENAVTLAEGEGLDSQKIEAVSGTPGSYKVTLVQGKKVTLVVKTERTALENAMSISFNKSAPHMELDVHEQTKKNENEQEIKIVYQDETNENQYHLAAGAREIEFDLYADGPYTPAVSGATFGPVKESASEEQEDGRVKYSYVLLADALTDNDTFTITEEAETNDVKIKYQAGRVDVTAKENAVFVTAAPADKTEADDYTTWTLNGVNKVTRGTKLTVTVTALDNSALSEILVKEGDGEAAALEGFDAATNPHTYTFTLPVEKDTEITVESYAFEWKKELQAAPGSKLAPVKGKAFTYDVDYLGTYTGAVGIGAAENHQNLKITRVEIWDKNKNVIPEKEGNITNYSVQIDTTSIASYGATVTLKGGSVIDGTYTLVLYTDVVGDGDEEERVAAEYTLNVPKKIGQIAVNNMKPIAQPIDTTVSTYTLTATGIQDFSAVTVTVQNKAEDAAKTIVKEAKIVNNKLQVTTGTDMGETTLMFSIGGQPIDVKDAASDTGDECTGLAVKTTTLLRDADDPDDNTLKKSKNPEVKCVSATDISLGLQLTSKGITATGVTLAADADLYYEVKATPVGYDAAKHPNLKSTDTVKYVKRTGDSDTADIIVANNNVVLGAAGGEPCQYKVTVKLVHTKAALAADATTVEPANLLGESPETVSKDTDKTFATKKAAYETSLKLKKGTANVFTGQTNVLVATAQFSKDTTFRSLKEVKDITAGLTDDEKLDVEIQGDQIIAGAPTRSEKIGKHKIEVIAQSAQDTTDGNSGNIYASRAVIDVTVVRGIEVLTLTASTTTLYKAPKKAAALKTNLELNGDLDGDGVVGKDEAPKSKKVKYTLLKEEDETGTDVLNLKGGVVKVDKSGKVTVDKDYQVTGTAADNTFYVKVEPDDFTGNDAADFSACTTEAITITGSMLTIGDAVILRPNETGQADNLTRTATGTDGIQAGELDGAYLYAVTDGFPVRNRYDLDTVSSYAIDTDITYKSSNAKAVQIDAESGGITVLKPAKGVTLTAMTTDGGTDKKLTQKAVKVNVVYDKTGTLGLYIEKESTNNKPYRNYEVPADRKVTFNDADAAVFNLKLMHAEEDDEWEEAPAFTDYKLAASGGAKILSEDKEEQTARILVSKSGATVKLTNNDKQNKSTVEYTFINEGLAAVDKIAAPKAVITYETGKALRAHSIETQRAVLTLTNTNKNDPAFLDRENLYVLVEPDQAKVTAKNAAAMTYLGQHMGPNGLTRMTWNHEIGLEFTPDIDDGDFDLAAGSYALKVAVGTINDDGEFVPAAKPANVTLKVEKAKALSFKPTVSYTVSAKDGKGVALTGKGNYDTVKFSNLQNDNVNGRTKGEANDFKTYFTLSGNKLTLTDACYNADGTLLADVISKDDLTGYVYYEAYYDDDISNKVTGFTKITVKIKDIDKKYAISNASAVNQNNTTADVTVTANKAAVNIAYAVIDNAGKNLDSSKLWTIDAADGTWVTKAAASPTIPLKMAAKAENDAAVKVDLRVIPADSFYAAKVAAQSGNATEAAKLIQTFGIPLTTTVTLKSADKATKRIVFNDKSMKYAFKNYDAAEGVYVIDAPYAEVYKGAYSQIDTITVTAKKTEVKPLAEGDTKAISFTNVDADDYMGVRFAITMDKNKFMAEVAKDTQNKIYYKKDAKKGMIPQTLDFEVKVTYKDAPADKVTDKFTFKLTMPDYPAYVAGDGKTDFDAATAYLGDDEVVAQVIAAVQECIKTQYQNFKYTYDENSASLWDENHIKQAVTAELIDVIRTLVGEDSGIMFNENTPAVTYKTFTQNGSIAEGTCAVELTFTDGKTPNAAESKIDYEISLSPTGTKVSDVKDTVESFMSDNGVYSDEVTNNSTKADFLAKLRTYVTEQMDTADIANIRFAIDSEDEDTYPAWKLEPATELAPGSLKVSVKIWDVDYNDWQENGENEAFVTTDADGIAIDQLQTATEVIAAVKAAVGIEGTGADTKLAAIVASNNGAKAKAAVLEAAEDAIGANPYKAAFAKDEDWHFVPAGKTTKGTIDFILTVTDSDGKALADNAGILKLNRPDAGDPAENIPAIAGLMTAEEAKSAVEGWITANTLEAADDQSSTTKVLKNDVTAEDIINAITDATNGVVKGASLVTVTFAEDETTGKTTFDQQNADTSEPGYVKGTIKLEAYDKDETVTLNAVIPKQTQTLDQAKTAAETALDTHIATNPFTNDSIKETDAIAATKTAIIGVVEAVVDTDTYSVTIADADFTSQAADVNTAGNIKVKVTITNKTTQSETQQTAEKTYNLAALGQTEAEAAALIKTAVEKADAIAAYGITKDTQDGDATVTGKIVTAAEGAEGLKTGTFTITASTEKGLTLTDKDGAQDTKTVTITLIVKETDSEGEGTECSISFDVTVTAGG